jgi:hypothetical protein
MCFLSIPFLAKAPCANPSAFLCSYPCITFWFLVVCLPASSPVQGRATVLVLCYCFVKGKFGWLWRKLWNKECPCHFWPQPSWRAGPCAFLFYLLVGIILALQFTLLIKIWQDLILVVYCGMNLITNSSYFFPWERVLQCSLC